jgi:hypothetical protein
LGLRAVGRLGCRRHAALFGQEVGAQGAPDLRARGAQQWPQTRAILQIPRRRGRLRGLTTHFVAFMRRHASNPPPGANFANSPPPLSGKLPSFGSRRPARAFYANSATFIQPPCTKVAEFAEESSNVRRKGSREGAKGIPSCAESVPSFRRCQLGESWTDECRVAWQSQRANLQ